MPPRRTSAPRKRRAPAPPRAAAPSVLPDPAVLEGLNDEQRRAVLATEGPLLVLAGAGSGKTRVITRRIAHLLATGVPASAILAVTFTNKAAREMRERVAALVGPRARDLTVSTFHALCLKLLRAHPAELGLPPGFAICDEADQQVAAKGALRELRIAEAKMNPRAALSRISLWKSRGLGPEAAAAEAADDWELLAAKAYRGYEAQLRRSRTVDFDDLLLLAGRLLREHPAVLAKLQDRWRYLLVDEYQDTNAPQYEVLRLLAARHRNLAVVGDDDQSIYGWRGADVKKILGFSKDFPDATVVRLETNYRSTDRILEAANLVIRNNPARHPKTLVAASGAGEPVRIYELDDEEHEAEFVVSEISSLVRRGEAKLGDVAILFRTAVQPRAFEGALRAARIPYDLVGGMSFFDRKEVRDVLAYLRLAANPHDEPSLLRVVNVPPRGVGKSSVDKLLDVATKRGISAAAVLDQPDLRTKLPPDAVESIGSFRAALGAVPGRVASAGLPQAVRELVAALKYPEEIARCYPDPVAAQARWAAVEEVFNVAENHARRTPGATLQSFLEDVALAAEGPEEEGKDDAPRDKVTLMTLHSAKGLEFPRVYLVGCEEGLLPHARSVAEDTVEEERRLMYVGITRARRHLALTRAKSRAKYGRREGSLPSRFLFELRGEEAPAPVLAGAPPAARGRRRR